MKTISCSIVLVLMATVLVASTFAAAAAAAAACDFKKDLVIWQSLGEPQKDGSAEYRVDVVNQCSGDGGTDRSCDISKICLMCGNFRSLIPVDPELLRVVDPGVCLLNGGHTIRQNGNVSFVYTSYVRQNLYALSAICQ